MISNNDPESQMIPVCDILFGRVFRREREISCQWVQIVLLNIQLSYLSVVCEVDSRV